MRNILIVAGGAVAVVAIAAAVYFGTRPTAPGAAPVAAAAVPADAKALLNIQPSDHVMGDRNAPITMIEYASLTCPHCAAFNSMVLPDIEKKWIATGKVKLIYRDFRSTRWRQGAQLAECRQRQVPACSAMFRGRALGGGAGSDRGAFKSLRIAGMGENEVKAARQRGGRQRRDRDYRGGERWESIRRRRSVSARAVQGALAGEFDAFGKLQ